MKKIELVEIRQVNDALAEMVALFRVELRSYKGIASKPNVEDGREEMKEYLLAGFPVFAATVHGEYAGYVVCRIESEVVWVESIFVREEYRRQGVAAALHADLLAQPQRLPTSGRHGQRRHPRQLGLRGPRRLRAHPRQCRAPAEAQSVPAPASAPPCAR